jgi:uncharacterized LabA/DUF88 family protein
MTMRVYVYVDGFNLYYRALKGTQFKWLNLNELAKRVLAPSDTVIKVRYFTARVSARAGDPDAPRRQQILFNAIKTVPNIEFHYGRFLPKTKKRPLVSTGKFVEIHDTEEKGSDVNLATHLLNDGWHKRYDVALVMSQDTDLIEPIRIVVQELGLKVGVVWLDGRRPSRYMSAAASFVRHISHADLAASQFPNPIILPDGTKLNKPATW